MKTIVDFETWAKLQLEEVEHHYICEVECDCEKECFHCGHEMEECEGMGFCDETGYAAWLNDESFPELEITVSNYKAAIARDVILLAKAMNIDIEGAEKEIGVTTVKSEEGVPLRAH